MSKLAFPNMAGNSNGNATIPVGARVRVACSMVDFFMFNMQEIGTVTANDGSYLGIVVAFDKPIRYQAYDRKTYEKTEHGFNAEHLQLLPREGRTMTDDGSTKPTAFPSESSVLPWRTPSRIALDTQFVTVEEALAMLPDSEMVTTAILIDSNLFVADYPKSELIAAISDRHPQVPDANAIAEGYGLVINAGAGADLFIKTRKETP